MCCVQMTMSDTTDTAEFVAFDIVITKLTNICAANPWFVFVNTLRSYFSNYWKWLFIKLHDVAYAGCCCTRPPGLGPPTMPTGDCWEHLKLPIESISLQLQCHTSEFRCFPHFLTTTNAHFSLILRLM